MALWGLIKGLQEGRNRSESAEIDARGAVASYEYLISQKGVLNFE